MNNFFHQLLHTELLEEFEAWPVSISHDREKKCISIKLSEKGLQWKNTPFEFSEFTEELSSFSNIKVEKTKIEIYLEKEKSFREIKDRFVELKNLWAKENLHLDFWKKTTQVFPNGFEADELKESKEILQNLYQNERVVAEKKPFVLDLEKSSGPYIVSQDKGRNTFIDGASQIASLSLGYNDHRKSGMLLHPELFQEPKLSAVEESFKEILCRRSEMKNVYWANSGAESVELALRCCQQQAPDRRDVIVFEGSFHGRTLLSLHMSYNPVKRMPFEIFPEYIHYVPFPENKTPERVIDINEAQIKLWSSSSSEETFQDLYALVDSESPLLLEENKVLLQIREKIMKENPLAVVIEPMQCEGGERYGSNRFFQSLRLLTRAHNVALVFDEVQTGFALGGSFFWSKFFKLITKEGAPDKADVICVAKKAQVAGVLTDIDLPSGGCQDISNVSLYRGYLQAIEADFWGEEQNYSYVAEHLMILQKVLGNDIVTHTRGQGICFAFDLPSKEVLMELVSCRFKNGLLFYPAGEKTARFRLLSRFQKKHVDQIFSALYKCFLDCAEANLIPGVPSWADWKNKLSEEAQENLNEMPFLEESIWGACFDSINLETLQAVEKSAWTQLFSNLVKGYPQVLSLKSNKQFVLKEFESWTLEKLWKKYLEDKTFTQLDLIWQASRLCGYQLKFHDNAESVTSLKAAIDQLEENTYEAARRDEVSTMANAASKSKGFFISCHISDSLAGMTTLSPLAMCPEVPLLKEDPELLNPKYAYSLDITVAKEFQSRGLGLRLKVEQILEAKNLGVEVIRSRNRFPEAYKMQELNQSLGAFIVNRKEDAYEGNALALYQSLNLTGFDKEIPFLSPRYKSVLNKGSLANFVSKSYVRNMTLLGEFFPSALGHLYLSSGRAEALDKALKLLKKSREEARLMLSVLGDSFGLSTATTVSLGCNTNQYFSWPTVELKNLNAEYINKIGSAQLLGITLNLDSKSDEELAQIVNAAHETDVPVIFDGSDLFKKGSLDFIRLTEKFKPAVSLFSTGNQLGVIACQEKYFLRDALMMISTWDGDENALNVLRQQMFDRI